jgi:hypothetical protein
MVTRLQRCSCTDHRPVASLPPLRCCCCKRVSETTAGLRQPLLVGRTHVHAQLRLPSQSGRAVRGRLTASGPGRSVGSRSRFAYLRAVRGRLTATDPGRTGFPDSIGSTGPASKSWRNSHDTEFPDSIGGTGPTSKSWRNGHDTGFPDSIGSAGLGQAILVGSVLTWAGLRVSTPARRLWRG